MLVAVLSYSLVLCCSLMLKGNHLTAVEHLVVFLLQKFPPGIVMKLMGSWEEMCDRPQLSFIIVDIFQFVPM